VLSWVMLWRVAETPKRRVEHGQQAQHNAENQPKMQPCSTTTGRERAVRMSAASEGAPSERQ